MLFNSSQFAVFFIIIYILYIVLDHKRQNWLLLVGSYVFYGAWDWRFLSLIFLSTILDYFCGIKIFEASNEKKRKFFLSLSIFGNLAILGFFKYFDFFASNLQALLVSFGVNINPHFINIILPIGISFYTFQTMSYTIDIYRKQMTPTRKFFDFTLFVAFFPQLVAGPIERARDLLPQIIAPRKVTIDKFLEGVHLIFWGLFQKIFVADNLAKLVDPVFNNRAPYNGAIVLIALYAFAFQIFCDFAGYSDIARGLGKCMGFEITINFNLPYFVTNPRDFWKRWHISLSSWLKDYLYIPLGGNRRGAFLTYRNIMITMLLGGLWHGAAWTFVVWGLYQGLLLITYKFFQPFLKKIPCPRNTILRDAWFIIRILFFFQFICFGWLIFRAESIAQAISMLQAIISIFHFTVTVNINTMILKFVFFVWLLFVVQLIQFRKDSLLAIQKNNFVIKAAFYYLCLILMIIYGVTSAKQFIYFQF